jgi:hypothetical protein
MLHPVRNQTLRNPASKRSAPPSTNQTCETLRRTLQTLRQKNAPPSTTPTLRQKKRSTQHNSNPLCLALIIIAQEGL